MQASGPDFPVTPPEHVFDWLDDEADRRAREGRVRRLRARTAQTGELDLAGNDYLGLAHDKRVTGAAAAGILRWGAGATGSRTLAGSTELHAELEHRLAQFCGAPAALVFSSGFLANLGAVTALSGTESAIVTDKRIHPSLREGCRLSRADVAAVAHNDPTAVAHALITRRQQRALVVTDSVFSVDGDLAPLERLSAVCRNHGAALLINDAHGFGVLGTGGKGAVHAAGLTGEPDVVTTLTLSASLGAQGGAVLGPQRVIRHLVDTARSFLFDTALAPGSAASALASLDILRDDPDRPERALTAAGNLAHGLAAAGFPVDSPEGAIVSVRTPSPNTAGEWANRCLESGVRVGCVRPPSVPDGESRIRLTARADLTESDIERATALITEAAPRGIRA